MPRTRRLDLAGLTQHVIQRGNDRQPCFFREIDYIRYLQDLRDSAFSCECSIHAYVLMTNHVHLLVTPRQPGALALDIQPDRSELTGLDTLGDEFAIAPMAFVRAAGQRHEHRMWRHQRIVPSPCVGGVAGPAVVIGVIGHCGADRIQFDVTLAGQEVALAVYQA